jgi:hypothetical protein
MYSACNGLPLGPKYGCQDVTTWYNRPPMIPNGTAQIAMSMTAPGSPPRCTHRRSVSHSATRMPAMMQMA